MAESSCTRQVHTTVKLKPLDDPQRQIRLLRIVIDSKAEASFEIVVKPSRAPTKRAQMMEPDILPCLMYGVYRRLSLLSW